MAKKLEKRGVPAYMVTLGDMWSLMLTFFIMLFAMSQVDATKFKKVEGSLKNTFGYNQQTPRHHAPPGVNPVDATSASDHFPDDIIFDHPIHNSINDPEFAARKIASCERHVSKQKNVRIATIRNGDILQRSLSNELSNGVFTYLDKNTEASVFLSAPDIFENSNNLRPQTRKALERLALALSKTKGNIKIRGYMPSKNATFPTSRMIQQISSKSSLIGELLSQQITSLEALIHYEVVPAHERSRTITTKQIPDTEPSFEIAVAKD
jgi:flagellar motor protein MotB